jgi:hypothetical protein
MAQQHNKLAKLITIKNVNIRIKHTYACISFTIHSSNRQLYYSVEQVEHKQLVVVA